MNKITGRSEFAGESCAVLPLPPLSGPAAIYRALIQDGDEVALDRSGKRHRDPQRPAASQGAKRVSVTERAGRWQVLPHEMVFGALIVTVLSRLVLAQGGFGPLSLVYVGMLLVIVAGVAWCRARESDLRWRIRYGIYPALISVCYFTLGIAVPVYYPGKLDAVLQSLDVHMVGGNVSLWLEHAAHPVLTEILSACYLAFFPYVMLSWAHYFRRELPVLRRFIIGMFTVYGIGYLGYALAPAVGPQFDPVLGSQFADALTGGWITQFNAELMLMGSNRVDAFPSLHCAVTAFTLFFDRVHAPRRFRMWVLPLIGLWIATLYLRYHYLTDVIAGMALAGAALVMVQLPRMASLRETRLPVAGRSGSAG